MALFTRAEEVSMKYVFDI